MTEYFVVRWKVGINPEWYEQGFSDIEGAQEYMDKLVTDEKRWNKEKADVRIEMLQFKFDKTINTVMV